MTDEMLSRIVSQKVMENLAQNEDAIVECLSTNMHGGNVDADTAAMIVASMKLSIRMSVQMTLRILENVGVIDLNDYGPLLKVVPGGREQGDE